MLSCNKISYSYKNKRNSSVHVLENISVDFELGKLYTIYGPSGSGKSTLLALLGGLDVPDSGSILLSGNDINEIGQDRIRSEYISYVFQNYCLFTYMTARENVLVVMQDKNKSMTEKNELAESILLSLNVMPDEMNRKVKFLSGGQQQRVAIARCLAAETQYILADEPTGNLDNNTAEAIIDIFLKLAKEKNKCVIVVTHSERIRDISDISYTINNHTISRNK